MSAEIITLQEHSIDKSKVDSLKAAYARSYCRGCDNDEIEVFVMTCIRTGLSPENRQIFAIKRYDHDLKRQVMIPQVSIDGYRLVAERSGKYAGQCGPYWCGEDGKWVDVWLSSAPPKAAKVGVYRKDWQEPCYGIAVWDSYVQTKKDGEPTQMWKKMAALMLAKCAEALALRKAFPAELSGIYTVDEMAQVNSQQAVDNTPNNDDKKRRQAEDEELKKKQKQLEDAVNRMIQRFVDLGVTPDEICDKVGAKDLYNLNKEQFAKAIEFYKEVSFLREQELKALEDNQEEPN